MAKPAASGGLGLRLPQGGLGAVFSAAFSTPEALPGVAELLRDDEFLEALSRTASFISERGRDDAIQVPRRAVQTLHRLESPDAVRSVSRSLIFACAELFANRRLFLEPPSENVYSGAESSTDAGRLNRLCKYLTCITDLIQDGASQFQEPTLWKIIDDEFIARIHGPLAQELNQLYRIESASTTAILTVFERLDECAQSLAEASEENRQIVALLAGFILRRLAFVLKNITTPEVRSIEDSGLRDRIAEKLAHKLGVEIEQYRARGAAPLMHMLKEANGEGYSFVQVVFSGFFRLHGDLFRKRTAWSAESTDRQNRLLQGYETLGACASILWPAEFSGLIRENYAALDPYHRAAALQILQYAVADDPRSMEFALREAIRLLGHGALIVRDEVCRLLTNLVEPLAGFLAAASSQDSDALTLIRKHQQFVLEKVFVPVAQRGELSATLKVSLSPLLLDLIRGQGAALFRDSPHFGRLITWDTCKKLDSKERQKLVHATMEGYANQASSGMHGERGYLPNRDQEEMTAGLLASLGPQGLIAAFQYATELMRTGNSVGAQAVRLVASRAARELPDCEWPPLERTAFASVVFGDVFAALHEVVQRKTRLMSGARQQAAASGATAAPVAPERKDDLDLLVSRALERHTLQGSLPESLLSDPAFVGLLAALEGEVIRGAIGSSLMPAKRLADFVHRLRDNDLQNILTQYLIETRFAISAAPIEPSPKRLANLIELYLTSPSKTLRAQQAEFQRIRTFLVEEIEADRLPYARTPEINRALGGIVERALRESLLGSSEVYHSGDEELHLAVDVLATHVRKGESEPQHACRRFLACWFKVFPPADRHRNVRVSLEQVARVFEAVVQREGDSDWAGKAVYLLAGKLESQLQASRSSTEALQRQVVPLIECLNRCVRHVGPEREVSFEKSGVAQRHNIHAVAFRVLEQVRMVLNPKEPTARSAATVYERIPRIPFEYRAGARVHVPGLNQFQARIT